ncbi:hypothetical protein GCM10023187_52380 [Nibrella viscosa]|uniref:DUF4133 domain-containing protein n=1 Tax=Nibrella viscosa TaxID=1084524 RepID=A0ABP8KXH5_9BACT
MYRVNKGVDRPPEVLGIRGMNFLLLLAGAAVGLLLLGVIIMVATGISSGYIFGAYFFVLVFLYGQLVRLSKRFGERGLSKHLSRTRQPRVIYVRSAYVFRRLNSQSRS